MKETTMQTLTIQTLEEKRANELEKHKRALLESLDDVKHGRVTPTGITVNLKS
jgi:hypothetical protein